MSRWSWYYTVIEDVRRSEAQQTCLSSARAQRLICSRVHCAFHTGMSKTVRYEGWIWICSDRAVCMKYTGIVADLWLTEFSWWILFWEALERLKAPRSSRCRKTESVSGCRCWGAGEEQVSSAPGSRTAALNRTLMESELTCDQQVYYCQTVSVVELVKST